MNTRPLWLAALAALAAGGLLTAQTPAPPGPGPQLTGRLADAALADPAGVYENVEILRRVLAEALYQVPGVWLTGSAPPTQGASGIWDAGGTATDVHVQAFTATMGGMMMGGSSNAVAWDADKQGGEGTYLKGYGIVYSMTLPVHFPGAVRQSPRPAHKSLSPWERARRELRGEKVDAEARQPERHDASLTEAVLRVLAENGSQFSQLEDGDRLTVALTLRPAQECTACHAGPGGALNAPAPLTGQGTPMGAAMGMGMRPMGGGGPAMRGGGGMIKGLGRPGMGGLGGGAAPEVPPKEKEEDESSRAQRLEVSNYVHLGDARLKQGRVAEAVAVYEKALAVSESLLKSTGTADQAAPDVRESVADVYTRLARAYLLQGDADRAHQVLQRAAKLTNPAGPAASAGTKADTARVVLPAKVVISVTRRLADQVGSRQITFEAFAKAAEVQYFNFPVADKAPAKPTGP
jgi:tetratricopeptide (TPR) repeat protein